MTGPAARPKTSLVIGAGVSGLAAAWKLAEAGRRVEVIERSARIGGASRTLHWGEFRIDTGPHKIYTLLDGILDSIKNLLGDELIEVPKQTSIYIQRRLLDYPFRLSQLLLGLSPIFGLRILLGYLASVVQERSRPEISYEDWIVKRFGWPLYRATFQGLAEKIWSNPRELAAELARRRIVTPGMLALIKRILLGSGDGKAPADIFYYPRTGISRLSEKMRDRILAREGKLALKSITTKIFRKDGRITGVELSSGGRTRELPVEHVVSTISIHDTLKLLSPPAPEPVLQAAGRLKMSPIMLALVGFKASRLLRDSWIFFPDKRYLFNRVSEQKGFSQSMGPADKTALCFDITAAHMPEAWGWPADRIIKKCLGDLEDCGLYHGEEVVKSEVFKLPDIYPLYDLRFQENLRISLDYIETVPNLFMTGRNGLFCYNNIDQCLDMSYRLAAHILKDGTTQELRELLKYFDTYTIVD